MTTRQFGQPIKRREDPRLVTGGGRYLDDLGHTAYAAAFVRSPHAHATVADLDVGAALAVPGQIGIWTPSALPGQGGGPGRGPGAAMLGARKMVTVFDGPALRPSALRTSML